MLFMYWVDASVMVNPAKLPKFHPVGVAQDDAQGMVDPANELLVSTFVRASQTHRPQPGVTASAFGGNVVSAPLQTSLSDEARETVIWLGDTPKYWPVAKFRSSAAPDRTQPGRPNSSVSCPGVPAQAGSSPIRHHMATSARRAAKRRIIAPRTRLTPRRPTAGDVTCSQSRSSRW